VITVRALRLDDFPAIHRAFVDAFSDYVVKLSPTAEQLHDMITRRGWTPELSCGAFDGNQLVAFTLNAFDGVRGYDTGTGVIPSHRRRGWARHTMEWSVEALKKAGAKRYVLEVIDVNKSAFALYRDSGFEISRTLQSWTYESERHEHAIDIAPDWRQWRLWWDVEPSWQNSLESVERAPQLARFIGDTRGYAIVFASNGDVPQLAVARDVRRRRIGRNLLDAAATIAGKPLRIMNVDAANHGIASFLEACGAKKLIAQLEMTREL